MCAGPQNADPDATAFLASCSSTRKLTSSINRRAHQFALLLLLREFAVVGGPRSKLTACLLVMPVKYLKQRAILT